MKFITYRDINYGFTMNIPKGWLEVYTGLPRMRLFSNNDKNAGIFLYILGYDENFNDLKTFIQEISWRIFGSKADTIGNFTAKVISGDTVLFNAVLGWHDDTDKYAIEGSFETVHHVVNDRKFQENFITAVLYLLGNENTEISYLRKNLLNLVKKEPSLMGFNVPPKHYKHSFGYQISYDKWEIIIPITWRFRELHDGFLAEAGGCLVGINPYMTLVGRKLTKMDIEIFAGTLTNQYTNMSMKTLDVKVNERSGSLLGEVGDQNIRIYMTVELIELLNSTGNYVSVPICKFAIYPTWLEKDFLTIALTALKTWRPLGYFMYELLGYQHGASLTPSGAIKTAFSPKISMPKKVRSSAPHRKSYSERFRDKIKSDMKRLLDWEKKLWTDTYNAIKQSDIITGIYTLEDKRKRTKMIYTGNLAMPQTHNFWKHKDDLAFRNVLATRKPFAPRKLHEWEKLKWHWEQEQKRLEDEIKRKKRRIDDMFS
ncbi:MAG: hypothetical protein Q6351_001730 [Candidatus Njordarchaeum guaymaensis]